MNSFFDKYKFFFLLSIPVLSLVLHWKILSLDLAGVHCFRQMLTQQNIQHYYRHDSNILNPRISVLSNQDELTILRYELPLLQWAIAMSYHITGESILVSRIWMFLLGLLTIAGTYSWLKQFFGNSFTTWAGTLAFTFSPVFFCFMINPLPDLLALSGTMWSLAFFFRYLKTQRLIDAALSALCISIAIAAKLPYAVFLAAPGTWWLISIIRKKFRHTVNEMRFALVFLLLLIPPICWYSWVAPQWQNGLVTGILDYQITKAQVFDYLSFHGREMFPKRLLGYCAIPFVLIGLSVLFHNKSWRDIRVLCMIAISISAVAYWIYEFSIIEKVHDYYMIPFLPSLYLLVAAGIYRMMKWRGWFSWIVVLLLGLMPFLSSILTKKDWSVEYATNLQDVFKYKHELEDAVPPEASVIIINDPTTYGFLYLTNKQGFVFRDDYLPASWVKDMIDNHGVTYMYSDSRSIDMNPEVNQYFDKLILEKGSVKVFSLKKS